MSKERFHEIVKEMVEIHDKKNQDYAGNEYLSNFLLCEQQMGYCWGNEGREIVILSF